MKATCGHEDTLGYLSGTKCKNCVRKAHAKAVGRTSSKRKKK